jgi:hypothetical protein
VIRRPNGADNLRRSDSIGNNFRADQRSLNYRGAKRGIAAASAAGFCARTRPPGTEFLDAETGPQISPPKWVSAHRDKNPGNEWSEIPAETPYLALCRKHAVCKDWMVGRMAASPSDPIAAKRANAQPVERLNELAILVPIWLASSAAAFS